MPEIHELAPTLMKILHDFDGVLCDQVGGLVTVRTDTIAGSLDRLVADGGPIKLVTRVEAVLTASKPLTIDLPLVSRATNAEELLRYVVDEHYKPFQERLAKAAHAASLQWAAILDG